MYYAKTTGGFYDSELHGKAIPKDAVEISKEEHSVLLAGQSLGKIIRADINGFPVLEDLPAPSIGDILRAYRVEMQRHLDVFASTRGYDSILSACSYAVSENSKYASEGKYAVTARDAVWDKGNGILDDIEAGRRPLLPLNDFLSELPVLNWPR